MEIKYRPYVSIEGVGPGNETYEKAYNIKLLKDTLIYEYKVKNLGEVPAHLTTNELKLYSLNKDDSGTKRTLLARLYSDNETTLLFKGQSNKKTVTFNIAKSDDCGDAINEIDNVKQTISFWMGLSYKGTKGQNNNETYYTIKEVAYDFTSGNLNFICEDEGIANDNDNSFCIYNDENENIIAEITQTGFVMGPSFKEEEVEYIRTIFKP